MNTTPPTSHVSRRLLLRVGTTCVAAAAWPAVRAQPVLPAQARVFVGFPPGGAPDIVARRLAAGLAGKLATTVIVENRPGAGSRIALDSARQMPPDGSTLLLSPAGIVATNPHTYRKLNYDPVKDLTPITLTHTLTLGFAVGPAVPPQVRDIASFAAWAKSQPAVSYGTPAAGAPPHFVGDWLSRSLKLNLTHVPYRGGAPAVNDLMGGNIAAVCLTLGDLVKQTGNGGVRLLAVTGARRSSFVPDVSTFGEQGLKSLDRDDWFGLYVAGQASAEVVLRLSALTREVQTSESYQRALRDSFLDPTWSTPQELAQRGREDLAHWAPIIKASGFTVDS